MKNKFNEMTLKDKTILVTGGSGFFGSHIVDKLREEFVNDIIIPRSKKYDLRIRDNVIEVLDGVDIVIHAAGTVSGIGGIQKIPATTLYDNAIMALLMMEEAQKANVEKFIAIGTACSYPKFGKIPLKENEIWDGFPEETNASYGIAKRLLLIGAQAYKQQYNFNIVPLVVFNLYGPRDNFDLETSHVIPALIRKCFEEDKLVIWGDGTPTRSFLYVEDAAKAVILALKRYNNYFPLNIGTSEEVSIKRLVEMIVELTNFKGQIDYDTSKPNGQPRRCADVTLAMNEIGFQAKTSLYEGLKRTISWYKSSINI